MSPLIGEMVEMAGVGKTVNSIRLLGTPPTVTWKLPVVSFGTIATMLVGAQLVTIASVWFRIMVLAPWIVPKPEPASVTELPAGPEMGDKEVISGSETTTVSVVEPHIVPVHAPTVVVPVASPSATPRLLESLEIVATVFVEELHVTEASVCVLLLLNVPVAVSFCAVPTGIDGFSGLTAIDTRFGGMSIAG